MATVTDKLHQLKKTRRYDTALVETIKQKKNLLSLLHWFSMFQASR